MPFVVIAVVGYVIVISIFLQQTTNSIVEYYWFYMCLMSLRDLFQVSMKVELVNLARDMHNLNRSIGRFFKEDLQMEEEKKNFPPVLDLFKHFVLILPLYVKNQYLVLVTVIYALVDATWSVYTDRKAYRLLQKVMEVLNDDMKILLELVEMVKDEEFDFGEEEEECEDSRELSDEDTQDFDKYTVLSVLFLVFGISALVCHVTSPDLLDDHLFLIFFGLFHWQHLTTLYTLRLKCQQLKEQLTATSQILRDNEKAISILTTYVQGVNSTYFN